MIYIVNGNFFFFHKGGFMDFIPRHNEMVKKTMNFLEEAGKNPIGRCIDPCSLRFLFEHDGEEKIIPLMVINHARRRLDVYPGASSIDRKIITKIRDFYLRRGYAFSPTTV